MTERTKLTRGLADISPLFIREKQAPPISTRIVKPDVDFSIPFSIPQKEVFFVWSVDDESDAHFLNTFLASKLASLTAPALLMKLEKNHGKGFFSTKEEASNQLLHRVHLPVEELSQALSRDAGMPENIRAHDNAQVFLETSLDLLLDQPDLIPLLDHIILFVRPQIDSVTEVYRRLKQLVGCGLRAEISVLFDAEDAGGLSAQLYELFSDLVSRRLSLSMNYLGTLHLSRSAQGLRQDIRWEGWNSSRFTRPESIEKMRFFKWVEQIYEQKVA